MVEMGENDRVVLMYHIWPTPRELEIMERAEAKNPYADMEDRRCPRCGHWRDPYTGWCPCEDEVDVGGDEPEG